MSKDNPFNIQFAMARKSKYENTLTDKSINLASDINKKATCLTIDEIEALQTKYGVSDAHLADFLEIQRSIISYWKNGKRELPKYYIFNIYFLFRYLEERFKIQ